MSAMTMELGLLCAPGREISNGHKATFFTTDSSSITTLIGACCQTSQPSKTKKFYRTFLD